MWDFSRNNVKTRKSSTSSWSQQGDIRVQKPFEEMDFLNIEIWWSPFLNSMISSTTSRNWSWGKEDHVNWFRKALLLVVNISCNRAGWMYTYIVLEEQFWNSSWHKVEGDVKYLSALLIQLTNHCQHLGPCSLIRVNNISIKINVVDTNYFTKRGISRWFNYQRWFDIKTNYLDFGQILRDRISFNQTYIGVNLICFFGSNWNTSTVKYLFTLDICIIFAQNPGRKYDNDVIIGKLLACKEIVWCRVFFGYSDVLTKNCSHWIELGLIFLKINCLIIDFAFLLGVFW